MVLFNIFKDSKSLKNPLLNNNNIMPHNMLLPTFSILLNLLLNEANVIIRRKELEWFLPFVFDLTAHSIKYAGQMYALVFCVWYIVWIVFFEMY